MVVRVIVIGITIAHGMGSAHPLREGGDTGRSGLRGDAVAVFVTIIARRVVARRGIVGINAAIATTDDIRLVTSGAMRRGGIVVVRIVAAGGPGVLTAFVVGHCCPG